MQREPDSARQGCLYCGSQGPLTPVAERVRDAENFGVGRCAACGLIQITPLPSEEENRAFYDDNRQQLAVEGDLDIEDKRRKTDADTARRVRLFQDLLQPGARVLDVGCGYGFVVERLRALGYDAWGLEPSAPRALAARELIGIPLLELEPSSPPDRELAPFDMVSAFQVLEHIADPLAFLRWLRRLVGAEGKVLIEVPNADDHMLDLSPEYAAFYWQRAHCAYYTAEMLTKVVEAAGLSVDRTFYVQRYSVLNAMNWVLNRGPQLKTPSYDVAAGLGWLDELYRERLLATGKADTLILLASPGSGR